MVYIVSGRISRNLGVTLIAHLDLLCGVKPDNMLQRKVYLGFFPVRGIVMAASKVEDYIRLNKITRLNDAGSGRND